MTATAESLAALTVKDASGAVLPFSVLWADGPVVVAFVRHFG